LSPSDISEKLNTEMYRTMILPVVLSGYETWSLVSEQDGEKNVLI
jgi:hypothetical protein